MPASPCQRGCARSHAGDGGQEVCALLSGTLQVDSEAGSAHVLVRVGCGHVTVVVPIVNVLPDAGVHLSEATVSSGSLAETE